MLEHGREHLLAQFSWMQVLLELLLGAKQESGSPQISAVFLQILHMDWTLVA